MVRRRRWSDLHEDLLILIARKLQAVEDILLFRSVCVSWRSASKADKLDGTRQFPWLLLGERAFVDVKNKYLWDFTHDRLYKTTGLLNNDDTITSLGWKGWLLYKRGGEPMWLQHTFKKTTINLPEFSTDWGPNICKAVLSSDPFVNAFDYTLAIIYGHRRRLACWRPGDKSYTKMMQFDIIQDAIFHAGLLYAVHRDSIVVFDVTGPNPITNYQINGMIPIDFYEAENRRWNFLVEVGGDLMLLLEFRKFGSEPKEVVSTFKVFLVSEFSEWKEVKDLGNRAIFIGDHSQSFALDNASEIQGCKPDHIYLTNLGWAGNERVCTYNLGNAKVGSFDCAPSEINVRHYCKRLWVQPAFD